MCSSCSAHLLHVFPFIYFVSPLRYCCHLHIYLTYSLHIVISYIPYFYPFFVALFSSFYSFPVQNVAMILHCSYPYFKFLVIGAPRPFGGQNGPLSLELTPSTAGENLFGQSRKDSYMRRTGSEIHYITTRFSDPICERSSPD